MSADAEIENEWQAAQESLVLQSADFALSTLQSMVSSEQIDISPQYQRRERWDRSKQSELIESFLLNMPVPPIYLAEEGIGRFSVIDGKQRLTAIHAFLNDDLKLSALRTFSDLNGSSFSHLPPGLRVGVEVRPLRVVTVLRQSNEDVKYEVFRRLNESAVPLDPQEIRNVLYRGPLNDLLVSLSSIDYLRAQMKITTASERYKRMQDVELVLRFFALSHEWEHFRGDYRTAMDSFMRANRSPQPDVLAFLQNSFEQAIDRCSSLWGDRAFRRPEGHGWRDQALSGLYDAQMIGVSSLTNPEYEAIRNRGAEVIQATREQFQDPSFDEAVRQATNTPDRVRHRIQSTIEMLRSL